MLKCLLQRLGQEASEVIGNAGIVDKYLSLPWQIYPQRSFFVRGDRARLRLGLPRRNLEQVRICQVVTVRTSPGASRYGVPLTWMVTS